ncbi:MAG: hypothetical protein IKO75_07040 [Bacteroidales bacterium]|nr:hypothetical protein [Bacteroidales bacterium]
MVIKNVDVSDDLVKKVEKCIDFIKGTIESGTSGKSGTSGFHYPNPIIKVNSKITPDIPYLLLHRDVQVNVSFQNVSWFIHSVPIYLKNKIESKELGLYVTGEYDVKYILLDVEKIDKEVSSDHERFKMLLTTVLIHELMHAVLDLSNHKDYYNNSSTKNQSSSCPFALVHKHMDRLELNKDYKDWREEAYANALTLHLIEMSGKKKLIEYARNFMINQDEQYAVGASLSKISCIYEQTDDYLKEKNLKENNLTKVYDIDKWNKLRRDWVSCVKHIKNNIENKVDLMSQLEQLENQIRAFVRSQHKR